MDAREMSARLAINAESVASMLLPNGKRLNQEWCAGSIHGEAGQSLRVRLSGNKAGVWADFATGEGGDLIDLWRQVRGLQMVDALHQVREYLGVEAPRFEPMPSRQFQKPEKPKCQAPQSDVLAYLTQERKLTPETIKAFQVGEQGRTIIFPYKRGSELVMWKQIGLDRDAKGKKKIRASKDSEPILFGWQAMDPNASHLVITEGEIDAMTVHQWGHPALSVPFGGGAGNKQRWVEYEYPALDRFRDIYLCLDRDEEGQAATQELVKRLGAHRCKVVDLHYWKDANAALLEGANADFFRDCLTEARTMDPDELKSAATFVDEVIDQFYPKDGGEEGVSFPWRKLERVRLRPAELSIWTGINGHGKSQLLGHVMLDSMHRGEKVCIASMEIKPRRLLYRLTRQATGVKQPSIPYIQAVHEWFADKLWLFDVVGTAKAERILDVFRYACRRYGITQFVIDSLMKCGIAEDDYRGQKAFIENLTDFKNEFNCHVHLVAHSRKGEGEGRIVGKMDVKGTGAITDLADNGFSVWRNKQKEEELQADNPDPKKTSGPDAVLVCDKQRNGEWEGKIGLSFHADSFQYLESENDRPRRYVPFEGEVYVIGGGA